MLFQMCVEPQLYQETVCFPSEIVKKEVFKLLADSGFV